MRHTLGFLISFALAASYADTLGQQASDGSAAVSATVSNTAKPRLPYGVEDVLKLCRAEVSEEVILKYIRNTGTVYNLKPETIVYLKEQGVSDKVVDAMLDQARPEAAVNSAGTTSTWASYAPAQTPPQQQVAPVYTQPPQPDPAPAPAPAPRSTVHVIPYYPSTYSYYYGAGWPGYYPGYYRPHWYGPSISLGFGFGFGHGHRW